MASTLTFGDIEGKIRDDVVNDTDSAQYRFRPALVLAYVNEAIKDIAYRYNSWAKYDQATGERLASVETPSAEALRASATDASIEAVRKTVIPIDDRWEMAIVYLASAKCFLTDDSDTVNSEKASALIQTGMEYAKS